MILITGANGLVGRAIVDRLSKVGADLRLQVRRKSSVENILPGSDIMELDFLRATDRQFDNLTKNCSSIIHTASLVHKPEAKYEEYQVLNLETTKRLAQAGQKNGVKTFVFFSTIAVYGSGPFCDVNESSPIKPQTPYAVSKAQVEDWLVQNPVCAKTIVFRPSLIFGEGDRGNMLSLIRQINRDRYFHIGKMNALKSLIYSKDAAKAVDLAMNKLSDGYHIFNLANTQSVSVRDLADQIAHCLGKNIPFTSPVWLTKLLAFSAEAVLGESSPVSLSQIEKLITENTCSVNKLKNEIDFREDFNLEESLRAEISWASQFSN